MSNNGEEKVGSRGGDISKPTESTVIKLSTDVPLRNLELFKETVETFMKELTAEQRDIFELRWGKHVLTGKKLLRKCISALPPYTENVTISLKPMQELKAFCKMRKYALVFSLKSSYHVSMNF
ncbi:transcriptional regulator [Streptococcus pluranimalium]|uniref:transcriptional regulator n=1 Tax=Streptococcus pluranimalium TaxID=82348 RepID=UPI00292DA4AA|nr:transcriptional regulator [Streptococcus pluranimalium]